MPTQWIVAQSYDCKQGYKLKGKKYRGGDIGERNKDCCNVEVVVSRIDVRCFVGGGSIEYPDVCCANYSGCPNPLVLHIIDWPAEVEGLSCVRNTVVTLPLLGT